MKYYVKYRVDGFDGWKEAGPYDDLPTAQENAHDIEGLEGVHKVAIDRRDEGVPQ